MRPARGSDGGLSEASQLIQEGLRLLDERTREVDALVARAHERAETIVGDAERTAQAVTAEAERRRSELEEQITSLQAEVEARREELARLRESGRGHVGHRAVAASEPRSVAAPTSARETFPESSTDAQPASTAVPTAGAGASTVEPRAGSGPVDAHGAQTRQANHAPRWGRPSNLGSAQPAAKRRSARPRWLARWLPFLLVVLLAALVVLVNTPAAGKSVARATGPSASPTEVPSASVELAPTEVPSVAVEPAPTEPAPTAATEPAPTATLDAVVDERAVPANATELTVPEPSPTAAPTAPTAAAAPLVPTATMLPTAATAAMAPTATMLPSATGVPLSVPQPRAPVVAPAAPPPAEVAPDGPVVAAYTTYLQYSVRAGDTLDSVAAHFAVSRESIMRASGITDPNQLAVGQVLTVPRESGWLYRVQAGETLEQIAARFGTSADDLQASSMLPTATVEPGELVFIPDRLVPPPKSG